MAKYKRLYISGCNVALRARRKGLFIVADDRPRCITRALDDVRSHEQAKVVCAACEHASIQPYLSRLDEGIELPDGAAPAEPPEDAEAAADAPRRDDDTDPYEPQQTEEPVDEEADEGDATMDDDIEVGDDGLIIFKKKPKKPKKQKKPKNLLDVDFGESQAWGPARRTAPPLGEGKHPPYEELAVEAGIAGGPSAFGWSTLRIARQCLRMWFYKFVLGLMPIGDDTVEAVDSNKKRRPSALYLGALVHGMDELYLKHAFDGARGLAAAEPFKPYYQTLAAEATRLFNFYLRSFYKADKATLDVRFVELETRYHYPARKVRGKSRRLCLSARHDSGFRLLRAGQPRVEPGEPVDQLWLHDLKTIGRMPPTPSWLYEHQPQVVQGLLSYSHGRPVDVYHHDGQRYEVLVKEPAAERYGPARGFLITLLGKHQDEIVRDHTSRDKYIVDEALVEQFRREQGDFIYEEVADRFFAPDNLRNNPKTWPKSWLVCHDPILNRICPYRPLCLREMEMHVPSMYRVDERRILDPACWDLPKKAPKLPAAVRRRIARAEGEDK